MPRIIDISPRISAALAVWPGDVPFSREVGLDPARGDDTLLSSIRTTLHLGAHADAPAHIVAGGAGIAELPLERFYGPCRVIDAVVRGDGRILPADLRGPIDRERILLRTLSYPDPQRWTEGFAGISPELVRHLAERGVRLVGIDTPSVDPFDSRELEAHQELLRRGLSHLEGLALAGVEPGGYTLIALPLAIEGGDASPVRAALVTEE